MPRSNTALKVPARLQELTPELAPDAEALAELSGQRALEVRQREIAALDAAMEGAPSLQRCFSAELLDRSERRRLVSMAALPGWPRGPLSGYGWGASIDRQVGGLRPGLALSISADRSAVSGRDPATAMALQLAEGLALRTAIVAKRVTNDPLSPVMLITERQPEQLTLDALARWTGADRRVLQAGASAGGSVGLDDAQVAEIFQSARLAMEGPLSHSWDFIRVLDGTLRGPARRQAVIEKMGTWRRLLERQFSQEVWPVLVISPAATLEPGEIGGLITAARSLGWAMIIAGDPSDIPQDRVDVALHLEQRAALAGGAAAVVEARVIGGWGAAPKTRLHWFPPTGRVSPADAPTRAQRRPSAPAPTPESATLFEEGLSLDDAPTAPMSRAAATASAEAMLRSPRSRLRQSLGAEASGSGARTAPPLQLLSEED